MKMNELLSENESLKQQITLLSKQNEEKHSAEITQLKEKLRSSKKSVKDLKAEKVRLSDQIHALDNDLSLKEQDNQELKEGIEHFQQQLTELSDVHTRTISEVESLRVEQQALREKASQLQIIQPELDRLRQVENICNEKTAQVESLQAELDQNHQLLEQVRAEASKQVAEVQKQNAKLSNEMEMMRNLFQSELESQREQSGVEIASLQTQKNGLSTKITELTEKLNLVAKTLEKQLREKRKIASQYDTNVKQYQSYKDKSEKQINDLMALLQKMAAELDASKTTYPTQQSQPGTINWDKPANQVDSSAVDKPPQQQLLELRNQISMLNEINTSQSRELTALSKRMERINHILATPRGRLFSRLLGLKK